MREVLVLVEGGLLQRRVFYCFPILNSNPVAINQGHLLFETAGNDITVALRSADNPHPKFSLISSNENQQTVQLELSTSKANILKKVNLMPTKLISFSVFFQKCHNNLCQLS